MMSNSRRCVKRILLMLLFCASVFSVGLYGISADEAEDSIITAENNADFSGLLNASTRNIDVSAFTKQNASAIVGFYGFVSYTDSKEGILITGLRNDNGDSFLKFLTADILGQDNNPVSVEVGDYGLFFGDISETQGIKDTILLDLAIFESDGNDSSVSLSENFGTQEIASEVQKALNDSGYECGTPDGKIGPKTEEAISAYRESHGLTEGSNIDAGLIAALGLSGAVHGLQESGIAPAATKSVPPVDQPQSAETTETAEAAPENQQTFICNTNTKKFHYPTCSSVKDMKEKNKMEVTASASEVMSMGYEPCKRCNPH